MVLGRSSLPVLCAPRAAPPPPWGGPGRALGVLLLLPLLAGLGVAAAEPEAARSEGPAPSEEMEGLRGFEAPSKVPDDETLEAAGAVVGQIVVRAGDIFDPEDPAEDHVIFRAANAVHRRTREGVVRRLLLFKPGDRYARRVVDESERLLRSAGYLYDAEIRPLRYADGLVDVEVRTRDVWSLRGGVGFGRAGEANKTRVGLEDNNFLGTGTGVTVRRTSTVDRVSFLYRFREPNLLGRRAVLEAAYADNSDGNLASLSLERPFFSFDARWAAGGRVFRENRVDSRYSLGEVQERFGHRREQVGVSYGLSRGIREGRARRWLFGFTYARDVFAPAPDSPTPATLPEGRRLAYPWVQFQSVEDTYVQVHDLDRIARTEDLLLGRDWRVSLGGSAPAWGGDRSRLILEGEMRWGLSPADRQLLLLSLRTSGRWGGGGIENGVASGTLRYYVRDFGRHVFFAALSADAATNLDRDQQLLLGGDNGLRGYPLRWQDGDRRYLLTLEQRFYTDWHVLRLFHVGAAVFFDAGTAWFHGEPTLDSGEPRRDLGVGLRIGSSRSAAAAMVHVDVAVPLDRDAPIRKVQLLVTTKETF